jgi:hypothetical protein
MVFTRDLRMKSVKFGPRKGERSPVVHNSSVYDSKDCTGMQLWSSSAQGPV